VKRVLLAGFILALTACGLDTWPYLESPDSSTPALPGTPFFTVANPVREPLLEVPMFRGFELYYKFFSSDQSADRDAQTSSLSTREQLASTTYGFNRMCTAGVATQVSPFIPVALADRDDDMLEAILNFTLATADDEPVMTYNGSVALIYPYGTIYRSATEFGETKSFAFTDFDSGDSDLTGINWAEFESDGILDLVVYALSYGLQDFSPVYSTARPLGYIRYDF
jgi:hypothetical protein